MMDTDSLTTLLRGSHLNMEERYERGIWPHPPLKFTDLASHLAGILERETYFPEKLQDESTEGVFIARQEDAKYICISQRSFPAFERSEKVFSSPEDAAEFYMRWGLHLPGDLDGWMVIE